MNIEKVSVKDIKSNPKNPRTIKDEKFKKLVKSVQDFPEMLEIRPIVVDETMTILGGNMRFKACLEAGLTEVSIIIFGGLTEQKKNQFLIKDNVNYGDWDYMMLENTEHLDLWGMDLPDWLIETIVIQ
jgi:ParB-like chromosome segregation protein Spo0J